MTVKDNNKKIVLWEGFRKELPWIVLWILIGVMAYGYYQDKQICEEVLADPCRACYALNQTFINFDYTNPYVTTYANLSINNSDIPPEDKNPNDRTISNYK